MQTVRWVKACHKCDAFDIFHLAHLQWAILNAFSERLALMCTLKGNKNNFWESACVFEFSDFPQKVVHLSVTFQKKFIKSLICKIILSSAVIYCISQVLWV